MRRPLFEFFELATLAASRGRLERNFSLLDIEAPKKVSPIQLF